MPLMPAWVQQIAAFLPFQSTFYFPINALVGTMSPADLLAGLGMQVLWIVLGTVAVVLVWRVGVRQFSSVGN